MFAKSQPTKGFILHYFSSYCTRTAVLTRDIEKNIPRLEYVVSGKHQHRAKPEQQLKRLDGEVVSS